MKGGATSCLCINIQRDCWDFPVRRSLSVGWARPSISFSALLLFFLVGGRNRPKSLKQTRKRTDGETGPISVRGKRARLLAAGQCGPTTPSPSRPIIRLIRQLSDRWGAVPQSVAKERKNARSLWTCARVRIAVAHNSIIPRQKPENCRRHS